MCPPRYAPVSAREAVGCRSIGRLGAGHRSRRLRSPFPRKPRPRLRWSRCRVWGSFCRSWRGWRWRWCGTLSWPCSRCWARPSRSALGSSADAAPGEPIRRRVARSPSRSSGSRPRCPRRTRSSVAASWSLCPTWQRWSDALRRRRFAVGSGAPLIPTRCASGSAPQMWRMRRHCEWTATVRQRPKRLGRYALWAPWRTYRLRFRSPRDRWWASLARRQFLGP